MNHSINWNDEADDRLASLVQAEARLADLQATVDELAAGQVNTIPAALRLRLKGARVVLEAARVAYYEAADNARAQFGRVSA